MAITKLHLGSENYLYFENGQSVRINGYPVKRWSGSNTNWSLSTGSEVKDFKGKTIFDLEKILWYVNLKIYGKLIASHFLFFKRKYDKIKVNIFNKKLWFLKQAQKSCKIVMKMKY